MTDFRAFLDDPRRRNLAVLAGIALLTVLLAALGLAHQASLTAHREKEELFFPGLATHVRQIAHIRIESKSGIVDVAFKPQKGWVVESHDDYPASFEQVRATVVGLATLTTLERKTAQSDWLSYVDLVSPRHGGNGKEITIYDDKGAVLASLIAGKTVDIGDPNGATGLFARHEGDPQSWLLRSVFEPKSDPADWLEKQVMTIDRARIAEADVDPVSGPSYVVRREQPSAMDFKLAEIPKGREMGDTTVAGGVAGAAADFSFDDAKPAKAFDFSDPQHTARVVTKTFDGLTVTVNLIQQGQDYWATVSAEGHGADALKEAREINAHASGWAYKLPAYKGQQLMTPLENLLKPLGGSAAPVAIPQQR